MFTAIKHLKGTFLFSCAIKCLVFVLSFSLVLAPSAAQAQSVHLLNLPVPGTMVNLSPAFVPVLLKGMTIHPDDPLRFDFIVDSGNTDFTSDEIKTESERLVKYFLASMTVPKDDLWVNLSPYEGDRIIPEELGKTELGRDMLAQDYILKQLTASLMYPEKELGKEFWERIYQRAQEEYGTTEVPVDTFNKVWILPEEATVYEHGQTVYIVDARLKVMLDSDYQAMVYQTSEDRGQRTDGVGADLRVRPDPNGPPEGAAPTDLSLSFQIIKEIILPEIEKEVNYGKNFAPLRQIYHSLILAKWYKETLKNSLLTQVYADKNMTDGIAVDDPAIKDQIYDQYMEAYKKGVYNYIKEDFDRLSNEVIPRKYFSGGELWAKASFRRTSSPAIAGNGIEGEGFEVRVTLGMQKAGASSPIFAHPWTLKGAREVLNNPGRYSEKQLIKGINKIGSSNDKGSEDIDRLKSMLKSKSFFVRQAAEGYLTYDQKFEGYINALPNIYAVDFIGRLKSEKAIVVLQDLLSDSNRNVRQVAEKYLTEEQKLEGYIRILPKELAIEGIKKLLSSDNFEVRREAEVNLTDKQIMEGYIDALPKKFAIDFLGVSPTEQAIVVLKSLLSNSDSNIRLEAEKYLTDGQKIEGYVDALSSDISGVREEAVLKIGKLGGKHIIDMKFRSAYDSLPFWVKDIVSKEEAYDVFSRKGSLKVRVDGGTQHREAVSYVTSTGDYYSRTWVYNETHERNYTAYYLENICIKTEFGDPTIVNRNGGSEIGGNTWGLPFSDEYGDWMPNIPDQSSSPIKIDDVGGNDLKEIAVDQSSSPIAREKAREMIEVKLKEKYPDHPEYVRLITGENEQQVIDNNEGKFDVVFVSEGEVQVGPDIEIDAWEAFGFSGGTGGKMSFPDTRTVPAHIAIVSRVGVAQFSLANWYGGDGNEASSPDSTDNAPGGIDMNQITVDRQGAGVDIQFDPIAIQEMIDAGITGFTPVIINLTPLPSILPLLGLAPQREEDERFEATSLN